MDFWRDIWPTLIAPFIILVLSPIAIAIGNKIFARRWSLKSTLSKLGISFLTLIFFLATIALGYKLTTVGWSLLLQITHIPSYISALTFNSSTWTLYGLMIFFITGGAAYTLQKAAGILVPLRKRCGVLSRSKPKKTKATEKQNSKTKRNKT